MDVALQRHDKLEQEDEEDAGVEYEEAKAFNRAAASIPRLRQWARKGQAYSALRPGSWPANYRHLMTELSHPGA